MYHRSQREVTTVPVGYHPPGALGVLFWRVDFSMLFESKMDFSICSGILSRSTTRDHSGYYSNSAVDNPKCTAQRPPNKRTRRLKPAASRRHNHSNTDPAKHHQETLLAVRRFHRLLLVRRLAIPPRHHWPCRPRWPRVTYRIRVGQRSQMWRDNAYSSRTGRISDQVGAVIKYDLQVGAVIKCDQNWSPYVRTRPLPLRVREL